MIDVTEVEENVKRITQRILKKTPEELHDDSRLKEDLGADSLNIVELIYEVEQTFKVQIHDEQLGELQTFGSLVRRLKAMVEGR